VRARVAETARAAGRNRVTMADVNLTRQRFLNKMDKEVKGYQIDACFGAGGCPNRIMENSLPEKIEEILKSADIAGFLRDQVGENLKFHHEFRVTVSDCPNACSQPQIKDIGIVGAQVPMVTENECIRCNACVEACKEGAAVLSPAAEKPEIDFSVCVQCGQCIRACPTGTIDTDKTGYRVLLGGKLGRHPRLARELPGICSEAEVLDIVRRSIDYYKANSRNGERFGELIARNKISRDEILMT
jgi:dissimilatory sulfite reductase (desulfoviridin) alpha/beta subunit